MSRPVNLTPSEDQVLRLVDETEPGWGMSVKISVEMDTQTSWTCYILRRLVEMGLLNKIRRGVYEPVEVAG